MTSSKIIQFGLLSFILGVLLLFIFENFGTFVYKFEGKVENTKTVKISYNSPFGTEITYVDDDISQPQRKNAMLITYSEKISVYTQAMQKDFWYALVFGAALFILMYLAKQRRLTS
ncbi:hypothetical protein [Psychroflexus aestuariivivens]|uniref:hypothetical protein n=1 Tax=Psychroflexus aestuariivivens TaxID=1795040 RepID=UPI000FD93749|nr:hypothetical protein [Psychroflexus aestuariivivens]